MAHSAQPAADSDVRVVAMLSRGPASSEIVLWAVQQVVRQHTETGDETRASGRCARCLDNGTCPLLGWARSVLEGTASDDPS
jgi:hypothetical protein